MPFWTSVWSTMQTGINTHTDTRRYNFQEWYFILHKNIFLMLCIWAKFSDHVMWLNDYVPEHKGTRKNGDGYMVIPNNPKRDMSPWTGVSLRCPRGALSPWAGSDTDLRGQWKGALWTDSVCCGMKWNKTWGLHQTYWDVRCDAVRERKVKSYWLK